MNQLLAWIQGPLDDAHIPGSKRIKHEETYFQVNQACALGLFEPVICQKTLYLKTTPEHIKIKKCP